MRTKERPKAHGSLTMLQIAIYLQTLCGDAKEKIADNHSRRSPADSQYD